MSLSDQLRVIFVFAPILGLLVLGFLISLQSGVRSLGSSQDLRRFLGNLTRVLLRLFGYLAGLLAVQQLVGFPFKLNW